MGKVQCEACKKKCSGNALRVQDKYFHVECFKCSVCRNSLAQGGFFSKDGSYYCATDYQQRYGTKCAACGKFVEGEVATALGHTYHQKCFVCERCRQPFPSGEKVTFTGKECLCSKCMQIPVVPTAQSPHENHSPGGKGDYCGGCKEELKKGDALIALEKQWHIWCFKCTVCGELLHGEYMGKDGLPYCERDYQKLFGVKCTHCERYITGKVLQAGDNHHFHPTCARCSKCGDPFGDGEEMYLQGGAIWHPRCGPSPDSKLEDGYYDDQKNDLIDGQIYTPSLGSSRSTSPHGSLSRQFGRNSPGSFMDKEPYINDLSRVYTYSYLTAEPTQGYLRRPIDPRPPKSPQFHRPPDGSNRRRMIIPKSASQKQGMQVLVDQIQSTTPRPRSPHMNNEEPIELAHFPDAQRPKASDVPRIERDDFPAPPFPYTDPERRRRWSGSSKEADGNDEELEDEVIEEDPQLKKEEEELSKIATGIGKVFLKTVKDREKLKAWKRSHLDPRNASRTPSASKEPMHGLRYDNPVNASPSRDVDRPKPWEEEESFDRQSGLRSSFGRSSGTTPNYNVVSSLRAVPKPGYGFSTKSATLPVGGRDGFGAGDIGFHLDATHSSDFSSGKSDISMTSEHDRLLNHSASGMFRITPYSDGFRGFRYASYSPHMRRSLPNVNMHLIGEPPKMYPYHLLITNNYRLPPEIDRCHLERHLSTEEFHAIFHVTRLEFYRLPEWRRNDMKRRAKLY